jgi:hypothetical protein
VLLSSALCAGGRCRAAQAQVAAGRWLRLIRHTDLPSRWCITALNLTCASAVLTESGWSYAAFAQAEGEYNPAYPASERSASLTLATWLFCLLYEILLVFLQVRGTQLSGRRESNPHHQLGRLELCH